MTNCCSGNQDIRKGDPSDVEKNKLIAILGYIIPILFFVPLVTEAKDSPFAKFHANQHLLLFISYIAVNIVGSVLWRFYFIFSLCTLALFVLAVMSAISASRGEMKPLPGIGGIEIIK